jgi:hypothetical protein
MRNVVTLHDGLRALYPEAVVFGAIGTSDVVRELDRARALLGQPAMVGDQSALSVAVSADGVTIWAESPVLTLRFPQLAAIGVDEGSLDVAAVVAGGTLMLSLPLAAPAEASRIADRVMVALAARSA